jgi:hydrogenase nickel incorporation protein HypA/HybF
MHELSIATNLCEIALEHAGSQRILAIHVRLGELSSVVEEALQGSYEIITAGTSLDGARLVIERVPVVVWCPRCSALRVISSVQSLRCPECDQLTGDIRQGTELEITAIEVDEQTTPNSQPRTPHASNS